MAKKKVAKKQSAKKQATVASNDSDIMSGIFLTIFGAVWFLFISYQPVYATYMLPLLVFLIGLKMLFFE